jgi:hypothetical protein
LLFIDTVIFRSVKVFFFHVDRSLIDIVLLIIPILASPVDISSWSCFDTADFS